MNRKQRRQAAKQGKHIEKEPVYLMKPSDIKNAVIKGAGQKALEHYIHQQCLSLDKEFTLDMDTVLLFTMYSKHGWRKKRLKQLYKDLFDVHTEMRKRYEMDDAYPERQKLKEKGIDVESWYNKLFNDDGSYKDPKEVNWDDLH